MRIKLDENMSTDVLSSLQSLHDVHTVHQEGLSGSDDERVWQATQEEGRFLITQDVDFSDLRKFLPGSHAGVLLVRLQSPSRGNLNKRLLDIFEHEDVESWTGCFVVATDSKIRVRRPETG